MNEPERIVKFFRWFVCVYFSDDESFVCCRRCSWNVREEKMCSLSLFSFEVDEIQGNSVRWSGKFRKILNLKRADHSENGREQARQQGVINVRTHKCKIFTLSDDVLRHLSSQAMTFWLFSLFTLLLIHEAHKLFAQFVSNLFHSRVLCCCGRPAHIDSISEERAT